MPRRPPRLPLWAGPYPAPDVQAGDYLYDFYKQEQAEVAGWTEAPIPWPYRLERGGKRLPILAGTLLEAVREEAATAILQWWGVSRASVMRWRRALGVPKFNEGTRRLWRALSPTKLTDAARTKALQARKETKDGC